MSGLQSYAEEITFHAITTRLPRQKKMTLCKQVIIQLQPNHQTLALRGSSLEGVPQVTPGLKTIQRE